MSVVREPRTENADPFGDFSAYPPPSGPPAGLPEAPPPQPEPSRGPEPPVFSGPSDASPIASVLGVGIGKLIAIALMLAFTTGAFGLFQANLGNDGAPNVPTHVLDACASAKANVDPQNLRTGTHVAYEQVGSQERVTFETSGGTQWTCLYDPSTATALIQGIP